MGNVIGLSCPSCGGTLKVLEGVKNVDCPFCGSGFILSSKIGAERYYVEPELRDYKKRISIVSGKTDFSDLDLFFVPIIKVRAEIFGWFYAFKEGKRKTVYEETYTATGRRVRKARTIIEGRERIKKSVNVLRETIIYPIENMPMGLSRIELNGLKLLPYDDEKIHRFGSVLDLPSSIEYYMKMGLDKLKKDITDKYKEFDEFYSHLEPVSPHMTIIYHPVAFARFPDGFLSYDTVNDRVLIKKFQEKKKRKNLPLTKILPPAVLTLSVVSIFSRLAAFILFLAMIPLFLGGESGD